MSLVDGDQALREITRRYLGAFGPATREDLALAQRLAAFLGGELSLSWAR